MWDVRQNYETDYDKRTLTFLVSNNDLKGVRYKILEKGADINSKDGGPSASLHLAANYGYHEILKFLIEAGADVNIREAENGSTPIFMAKDLKTAEILIEAGAKVNFENHITFQPLHSLVREKNILPVIKFLVLHCNVDVNAKSRFGKMLPLHMACDFEFFRKHGKAGKLSLEIIKFLIESGANVDNFNFDELTPLMQLLRYQQPLDSEFIKIFRLVLRQSDISVYDFGRAFTYVWTFNQNLCEIFLEHVAVLLSLGAALSSHEDMIKHYRDADLSVHFERCTNELVEAKSRKIGDSWVTFYNLLIDDKRRLKNYAGNDNLVESFRATDWTIDFPIYGKEIMKKMEKGVIIRKFYDESCSLLSHHVPIFGPNHLIVRDVLDCCLTCSTKDLAKFAAKIN